MRKASWAAVISPIVASLMLAAGAAATPPPPSIAVQQQGALKAQLTSSTGTHWSWTIVDEAGATVATSSANPVTVSFPAAGDYRALLDATDDHPVETAPAHAEERFHVYDQPLASFDVVPLGGGFVALLDRSTGEPTSWTWAFPSGTFAGRVPPAQVLPAGAFVSLTVANPAGTHSIFRTVVASGPAVTFANEPIEPAIGATVTFTAMAEDADGTVRRIDWDLDDDGDFDDAAGRWATWSFAAAGLHRVAVRATDDRGVATVAFRSIVVRTPTVSPPTDPRPASTGPSPNGSAPVAAIPNVPAPSATRVPLLAPFPVVRIRGLLYRGAVRISLLRVQAPPGATIRVRCRGGSCTSKLPDVRVKAARRALRVRSFERRPLRAGTIVEVLVTAPQRIGKYTRFTVRRDGSPLRSDLCLTPGRSKPTACPTA